MKNKYFCRALSILVCVVMLVCALCIYAPVMAQAYDLENDYVLLDMEFVAASFYNSTSDTSYSTGTSDFYKGFACTSKRFTKSEIPVGSLIYVYNDFAYRPEGWKADDSKNEGSQRPSNVTKQFVVVDEEWWGDFATRAFNVSRNGEDISGKLDEVKESFKIYVPKPEYVDIEWNDGYYHSGYACSINATASNATQFICTQVFTKETLPVGSTILVDAGYRYRPEGWVNLNEKSPYDRPANVTTYNVEVTEEWWGDYNYRAFNISATDSRDISAERETVKTKFRILLPGGTVIVPERNVVRVLAIGNSYSNDALNTYASNVAAGMGLDVEFTSLYYSGCTLKQHYNFYTGDEGVYIHFVDGSAKANNVTMKSVLEAKQYDYISFQQGSWSSDDIENYKPYLEDLAKIVREYQPDAKFLIHQTWGYDSARSAKKGYSTSKDMFAKVEQAYAQASGILGGIPIIKSGKTVQILKESLGFTDDFGNPLSIYSDESCHLAPRGDYAASCAWVQTLFGTSEGFDIRNCTYSAGFADAAILREAAYQAVAGTDGATLTLGVAHDDIGGNGGAVVTLYNETLNRAIQTKKQPSEKLDTYTFDFTLLPEGKYYATVERNGYVTYTTETLTLSRDGEATFNTFSLVSGDLKDEQTGVADGIVDIADFIRIVGAFISANDTLVSLYDINADGVLNIEDLAFVKISLEK